MADRIRIHAKPYQGEYSFDLDEEPLTTLEWRWVKRISGYLPLTIGEGIRGGDPDVMLALAVIALHRAGRVTENGVQDAADRLARAAVDAIEELSDPSEVIDVDPQKAATATEPPTSNGGEFGHSTSASRAPLPPPTGHPDSRKSAGYDHATSAP